MVALLDIVQAVANEAGYSADQNKVIGSTDQTTIQLLAICNRLIKEIADEYPWPVLQKEGTITLVNGQATYAWPGDINYQFAETFWNRTQSWPLYGPYTPHDRQYLKSGIIEAYPFQRFGIRGMSDSVIEIDPTPTAAEAGQVLAFEYAADRAVKPRTWQQGQTIAAVGEYTFYNGNYYRSTNSGTTGATPPTHTSSSDSDGAITWEYYSGKYNKFLADTDEPVVAASVFELGVLERFSERKGVLFQPRYDEQLDRAFRNSKPAKFIHQTGRPRGMYPNAPGTEFAT